MNQKPNKFYSLIRLDGERGSAEAGRAAVVRFAFNVIADHIPAKTSSTIDMREPRSGKCRIVFDDALNELDETNGREPEES